MGRRKAKKPKKTRSGQAKPKRWTQVLFVVFPYLFSLMFLGSLLGGSYAFAVQSDLFTLHTVTVKNYGPLSEKERFRMTGLEKGEWLLAVDLLAVEERVQKSNPQYKEVKVQRILPNEIKVVLKRRLPFARIRLDKTYWIDATSVVLSKDAGDGGEYPLILGVPKPKKNVTTGSRIHYQALDQAIQILRDIQKKDILQNHRLAHLDISDTRNFVLWIDKKIEIRMGSRNWAEKLNKLAEAIGTLDIHPDKVRYIDLRFDDIIIGPR